MLSTSSDFASIRAERFVAGGEALAHDSDGRVVFVRGAVPGDEVSAKSIEQRPGWSRAVVESVLTPSPDRVTPPCPQRLAGCGGCDWQHVEVSRQLAYKTEVVREALRRIAHLSDALVTPAGAVEPTGYRTTVRVVGDARGRPSFRMDRSNDTIGAAPCLVAHSDLQDLLEEMTITPDLEVSLRVSDATGEATATWNEVTGEVKGLPDRVAVGPEAILHEQVAGHRLRVSAGSFFQSGPAGAALLVETVKNSVPELENAGRVVDAYSGVGLFAAAAAPQSSEIVAIETSRWGVADCKANLSNRSAVVLKLDVGSWRARGPADVVIADPSRRGLKREGVEALETASAPVLALVSCDPAAMARDAALLGEAGYNHERTEVLDIFPHTHHVECVTRFVRE